MGDKPLVAVVMGSDSDLPVMESAIEALRQFGVPLEVRVLSAHRSPEAVHEFALSARKRGLKVIIAGAGGSAHLAGVIASLTTLPVIGVPMPTERMGGMDSLLSTVQMPEGVPVATMGIGKSGARNAAVLAVQMLALSDKKLADALVRHKARLAEKVKDADARVGERCKKGE
jgi:phosphoribosylaminoimidazole carboxylase PurE protein